MPGPDFGPKPTKQGAILIRLLKDRPHAYGAEIGVNHGETQLHLLRHLPGIVRLFAVDPWTNYPGYRKSLAAAKWRKQKTFEAALARYEKRLDEYGVRNKVCIMRCQSRDAAAFVEDGLLDWVFIDANHAYEYVREDIALWTPKVKPGGIVAGHDYMDRKEWGVIRAVHEAFPAGIRTEKHYVWWTERPDDIHHTAIHHNATTGTTVHDAETESTEGGTDGK